MDMTPKDPNQYDASYSAGKSVFGDAHEPMLDRYLEFCDASFPILDIGAGQGRNSLFAARSGYRVLALEPSIVGARQLSQQAGNLKLEVLTQPFEELKDTHKYSGVMVFGLIQILSPRQRARLFSLIERQLITGGIVFLTGFGIEDSSYSRCETQWEKVADHHFRREDQYRFFLKPNYIPDLFNGYKTLHHWEGLGPWHSHDSINRERHSMVEYVGRKTR